MIATAKPTALITTNATLVDSTDGRDGDEMNVVSGGMKGVGMGMADMVGVAGREVVKSLEFCVAKTSTLTFDIHVLLSILILVAVIDVWSALSAAHSHRRPPTTRHTNGPIVSLPNARPRLDNFCSNRLETSG